MNSLENGFRINYALLNISKKKTSVEGFSCNYNFFFLLGTKPKLSSLQLHHHRVIELPIWDLHTRASSTLQKINSWIDYSISLKPSLCFLICVHSLTANGCLYKANGQFWCVVKIKWIYFSSLNHDFIVLSELLMPCQLFAQKCSNCQEITKISKCSVRGPPEHSAIGNIHRDILLLGIITLQHVIQNNCRWV